MRSLPSVASSDNVRVDVGFSLVDVSSVSIGVYSLFDVTGIDPHAEEIPFGGGLAKPSDLSVTLSTSPGWFLTNRSRLVGAEARLNIYANSDAFQPFVGRVRSIETDARDPNSYRLRCFDRLLDADPLIPTVALTDSWNTPHLEDLQSGYPLVYGSGQRPFYFAAVTSDLSVLLGPQNVSSANHTGSLWFCSDLSKGNSITSGFHNILFNAPWQQQSGALNVASNGTPFEIMDGGPNHAQRFWKQEFRSGYTTGYVNVNTFTGLPASAGVIAIISDNLMTAQAEYEHFPLQAGHFLALNQHIASIIPQKIRFVSYIKFQSTVVQSVAAGRGCDLTIRVSSGIGYGQTFIGSAFPVMSLDYTGPWSAYNNDGGMEAHPLSALDGSTDTIASAIYYTNPDDPGQIYSITSKLSLRAQVVAEGFKRYSIFTPQVSSADVAISTNPIAILDDVLSHYTSVPYRQAASSSAQVSIQSWQFNVLWQERQRQSAILDDFAKTCGFYAYAADSGVVTYVPYVQSATAAGSIAATLTTTDYLSCKLTTNPLGTTVFNQTGYSAFQFDYAFDYQLNKYTATAAANRTVNALCNSAYSAGAQKTLRAQSKYVMTADVASYALGLMTLLGTQGQDYVDMTLPARFFTLELADIISPRHPQIASGGLYQIVKMQTDYLAGKVQITAGRILNSDGT